MILGEHSVLLRPHLLYLTLMLLLNLKSLFTRSSFAVQRIVAAPRLEHGCLGYDYHLTRLVSKIAIIPIIIRSNSIFQYIPLPSLCISE